MAYVITVAQRKGGAGKTTLACQLTAAFMKRGVCVAGVDLDEQQSFFAWGRVRSKRIENDPCFLGVGNDKFQLSSGAQRRSGAELIVVDTPPNASYDVRRAIEAANLVLTPLQLSPIDLKATLPTAQAIGQAGKSVRFIVNRAPSKSRIADEIRRLLGESGLKVAHAELGNRTAFAESILTGEGVVETAPRSTAAVEIDRLVNEICDLTGQMKRAA